MLGAIAAHYVASTPPASGWTEVAEAAAYATDNTSSSSWNPFSISASAGEIITVFVSTDSVASALTPEFTLDKPAGETNSWIEMGRYSLAAGVPAATQRTSIFGIKASVAWSSHSLTITQSVATTPKVATWKTWSGGSLLARKATSFPTDGGQGTLTLSGRAQPQPGDLILACATADTTSIPSLDSDTTNGSWEDAGNSAGGATGLLTTDIQMRAQFKLVTASGDQTFNPTNADGVCAVVLAPARKLVLLSSAVVQNGVGPGVSYQSAVQALAADELHVLGLGAKHYNTVFTLPSGHTSDGEITTGSVLAVGNGTGSLKLQATHATSTGSEADAAVSGTNTNVGLGATSRLKADGAASYDVAVVMAADTDSSSTSVSATGGSTLDVTAGDVVVVTVVGVDDSVPHSSQSISIPGCTGTMLWHTSLGTSTGADLIEYSGIFYCESGTATGAPVYTATASSTNSIAAVSFTRVRVT